MNILVSSMAEDLWISFLYKIKSMSHPCCISLPSAKYFYDPYLCMVNLNKQQHCVTVFINSVYVKYRYYIR